MRVLQGNLKGRAITVPSGIRPVSNMVKKACFDIMRGEIEEKRVLDLFAGSGALGIEAISQGAFEAVFVDERRECISTIKRNVFSLKIDSKIKVYPKDYLSAIRDFSVYREKFDIIFLDPPYHEGKLLNALQNLEEYDILAPSGYVVSLCYIKDEYLKTSKVFSVVLEKKYGQTALIIYRKKEI